MRYKNVWDAEINLKPFFLGGVMKETGSVARTCNRARGVRVVVTKPKSNFNRL